MPPSGSKGHLDHLKSKRYAYFVGLGFDGNADSEITGLNGFYRINKRQNCSSAVNGGATKVYSRGCLRICEGVSEVLTVSDYLQLFGLFFIPFRS
ncbi:hypothetical protein K1719_010040 [Acacia pycnantha]|nr:hypothetical protein K1719_010040 [Acacia pycnantha]